METSLKTGFAQIFSRCPKNLSCPKSGGGCSPPRPPGPYAYGNKTQLTSIDMTKNNKGGKGKDKIMLPSNQGGFHFS